MGNAMWVFFESYYVSGTPPVTINHQHIHTSDASHALNYVLMVSQSVVSKHGIKEEIMRCYTGE